MDAYSEIIEGLTSLMAALGPGDINGPPPPPNKYHNPEAEERPDSDDVEEDDDDDGVYDEVDEEEGEEEEEGDDDDTDTKPEVSQTVWQTASVTVAAGSTFDVPLAFDAPCRCTFSFSIVEGSAGPIAFRITATESFRADSSAASALVDEYRNAHEGTFEVAPPGGGSAALRISLDNTASTFSSIDVKAHVCLEPLEELQALENFTSRVALRGLIQRKEAKLESHTQTCSRVGRDAQDLQGRLEKLRLEVAAIEGELKIKYKQMEQGAEMAELMASEIHELRCQLRKAP